MSLLWPRLLCAAPSNIQGQKCSAASRAYIPASLWEPVMTEVKAQCSRIKMGDVNDFSTFFNAVIDRNAFGRLRNISIMPKAAADAEIVIGGNYDDRWASLSSRR
jgi:1-pyrroline-5-carboxylate dehydrogenase